MPMGIGYEKPKGNAITISKTQVTIVKPEMRKKAIERKLNHVFPEGSGEKQY